MTNNEMSGVILLTTAIILSAITLIGMPQESSRRLAPVLISTIIAAVIGINILVQR